MFYNILNEIVEMFVEMSPYIILGLVFVGLLNLFVNKYFLIKHTGKKNFWSVFKAAIFGVPLPLCSCGVVPTAVYMSNNGSSKSSVISFLTSTPQTGIDSIIATYGMMGPVFAVYRPIAALAMGITSGLSISLFEKRKKSINIQSKSCDDGCNDDLEDDNENLSFFEKIKNSARYAFVNFVDDISIQFIAGVIIAGLISFFLPTELISEYGLESGIAGMLLVTLFAVPMYVCATASIPIAVALMMKGFSPGVAFVFLATGPATNAASISILTKVLNKKITTIYILILVLLSVLFGYLLDFIFNYFNITFELKSMHNHDDLLFNENLKIGLSVLFLIMLLFSLKRKYLLKKIEKNDMEKEYNIKGMSCKHCVANVEKAIKNIKGVDSVVVNLGKHKAFVKGNQNDEDIEKIVESIGYKVV